MSRPLDLLLAGIALLLAAPLMLLCAVAIKLDSPGPVFFRQARTGRDGRFFMLWKFRTMRHTPRKGALLTAANDPRVTRVGRILRSTSLDELPNLWNVLRGEMSLVGPRPEVPEITAHYTPFQRRVLTARPGLTGFSQVLFRQEIPVDRKMRFDNFYLKRRGPCLHLWILWRTLFAVASARGNR